MLKRLIKLALGLLLLSGEIVGIDNTSANPQSALSHHLSLPLVAKGGPPQSTWIGPGGGVINDLIFDPSDPNTVFAAAWGAGIFKSVDGGDTWRNVSSGLEELDVTAIEVSPKSSFILYVGTYEGDVYKSVDKGETWYPSGEGLQKGVIPYAIEIDPTRSKRIYLATRGISNDGGPPWNGVIYKSADGGGSWIPVLTDVGGTSQEDWAYDLSIHPRSTQVIYASFHEHGAYRSQDYGAKWEAINNGVTDFTGRAIEPDPHSAYPGEVYLGVFHPTGIFISQDGGENWELYDQGIADARVLKLSLDPTNSDTLYLSTFDHGVMKSTDGGRHWSSAGLSDETILDVVIQPGHSKRLLGGTLENGLFRSTDGGVSWSHSQRGLNASTITSLVVQTDDSRILYASLYPGWVARSIDGGGTWSDDHAGLNDTYIHALVPHPSKPHLLYALTDSSGLYRRDIQSGDKWQLIGENLPTSRPHIGLSLGHPFHKMDIIESLYPGEGLSMRTSSPDASVAPLLSMAFAASNPSIAYLGTSGSGVYRSADEGITWAPAGLDGQSVYSLVVHPGNPDRLYAAVSNGKGVQMSADGGVTWTDLKLPAGDAYSLSLSADDPGILFVGTDDGVYLCREGNWSSMGLRGVAVIAVAPHPTQPSLIYAGTPQGAHLSYDGGDTWVEGPEELQGIHVNAISFDPQNPDLVYYATTAHGVLRADY